MIEKTNIQAEVARRTGRKTTDVSNYEIRSGLQNLTMSVPALAGECTCDLTRGRANYDLRSLPAKFKRLEAVKLDDGDRDETFIKITSFDTYQTLITNEQEADYDEPNAFIVWNDVLYVYPTPDKAYSLRLFASIYERNEDLISLPDEYEEALISIVCYEVLKNKGLARSEEAIGHLQSYLSWVTTFGKAQVEKIPPTGMLYNDI